MAKIPVVPILPTGEGGGMVCGSYKGQLASGPYTREFDLGFAPRLLLIFKSYNGGDKISDWRGDAIAMATPGFCMEIGYNREFLECTQTGFKLWSAEGNVWNSTALDYTYYYIAFR